MLALSNESAGYLLVGGFVVVVIISYLPVRRFRTFALRGPTAIQLMGVVAVVAGVFFTWMQAQQNETTRVAEAAEAQAEENNRTLNDFERLRADAEYGLCVEANATRLRVRGEYRSILAQEQEYLDRLSETPTVDLSALPGYSEIQDPAVVTAFDSITDLLVLARADAVRVQEAETAAAQEALDVYEAAEPLEQCGDDPIPRDQPIRPPITVAPTPTTTPRPTTTTTSTTTTTTTTTTTLPPPVITQPPAPPAPPPPTPTQPPAPRPTTTADLPGQSENRPTAPPGNPDNPNRPSVPGNGNGNRSATVPTRRTYSRVRRKP